MHDLSQYRFTLPQIDDWIAGDDRILAFRVVGGDGDPVDISAATPTWELHDRPYTDDSADAVLDGSDAGVEVVTDNRVNTEQGEWEVRLDGDATDDMWGEFTHRPEVEDADGNIASWKGAVVLTA